MKHEDLEEILCVDSRKNRPCDLTDRLPYDTLAKLASDTKFIKILRGYLYLFLTSNTCKGYYPILSL